MGQWREGKRLVGPVGGAVCSRSAGRPRGKGEVQMGLGVPRAFVSYHDRQPDSDVSYALEQALERKGIEVWSMRQEKSAGQPWLDVYEEALALSQIFVAVVSTPYLCSSHCQNEVRIARNRQIEHTILVYPFLLERPDPGQNKYAIQALGRLSEMGGYAKYTLPTSEDIEGAAAALLAQVVKLGWTVAATQPVQRQLPLTLKPASTTSDVFVVLDETAPHAAIARRILVSDRRARPSGRGRWTVSRETYDNQIAPLIAGEIAGTSISADGGQGL